MLVDLNVLFDIPTNPLVLKINCLLNRYSFYQVVNVPTYKLGHTFDLLMTFCTPLLLPSCFCLILIVLSVTSSMRPVFNAELSRNLHCIDLSTFKADGG